MDKRELKFRSWNEELKIMCEPVDLSSPLQNYRWLGRNDNHIMQFTGILDKNGKEIYEGDVVEEIKEHWCNGNNSLHRRRGVVEFYNLDEAKFWARDLQIVECSSVGMQLFKEEVEVLGNIFEQPELLKK